jgi:hypothetical protein
VKPRYYVRTWDYQRQTFTPQAGVRSGPYSQFGLRRALRALRGMGYAARRLPRRVASGCDDCGDPSVLVEREDAP